MTKEKYDMRIIGDKERYYDDVIAPKLRELASEAKDHNLNFLAIVEWSPGEYGTTSVYCEETAGLCLHMARWASKCKGNVDAFWLAVQKYAMIHGHSSMFLQQQGIPCKPSNNENKDTP